MTRVLVTAAGSSPGLDILRSLRRDPALTLIAADADPIGLAFAARLADESLLLPRADREPEAFVAALEANRVHADALFLSIDKEIEVVARLDLPLAVPAPLARPQVLRVMLDKEATAAAAAAHGIVPRTYRIASAQDLAQALEDEGGKAWLRPASGTSGQGSLPVASAEEGTGWMALWRARGYSGEWMAQELLPGRNFNWTGIYRDGTLVAAAAMERISYWLGQLVPSGITGQVRQAVTVVDRRLDAVGDLAARALDARPDGIFSVDLRENGAGEPRLNEVNPRPAGRPWLYACAGVNIPLAALRSRLDLPLAEAVAASGLRAGVRLFRQLDSEPVVVDDASLDTRGID